MKRKPLLFALGVILSVVPPLLATLNWFPLFLREGNGIKGVSLLSLLLILVALVPLRRVIALGIRDLTGWKIWLLLFLFFSLTASISYEMRCISAVGLLSAIPADLCFTIARPKGREDKE